MTRRELLKDLAGATALGLTGAVIVATTSCAPTEAPASVNDPLLALVREYRQGMEAYNNAPRDLTDEEDRALAVATWEAAYDALHDDPPAATTLEGALEAIRMVLWETRQCGGTDEMVKAVLPAALAYFDGRASA